MNRLPTIEALAAELIAAGSATLAYGQPDSIADDSTAAVAALHEAARVAGADGQPTFAVIDGGRRHARLTLKNHPATARFFERVA